MRPLRVDMQCPNCRGFNQDNVRTCNHCGAQFPIQQYTQPPPQPVQPIPPLEGGYKAARKWIIILCVIIGIVVGIIMWLSIVEDIGNERNLYLDEVTMDYRNGLEEGSRIRAHIRLKNTGFSSQSLDGCKLGGVLHHQGVLMEINEIELGGGPLDGSSKETYCLGFDSDRAVYAEDVIWIDIYFIDTDGSTLDAGSYTFDLECPWLLGPYPSDHTF